MLSPRCGGWCRYMISINEVLKQCLLWISCKLYLIQMHVLGHVACCYKFNLLLIMINSWNYYQYRAIHICLFHRLWVCLNAGDTDRAHSMAEPQDPSSATDTELLALLAEVRLPGTNSKVLQIPWCIHTSHAKQINYCAVWVAMVYYSGYHT